MMGVNSDSQSPEPVALRPGRFREVVVSVFFEKLRRAFRTLVRPLVNLWLSARFGCLIHPLARVDRNVVIGRRSMIGRCILDTIGGRGRIEIGSNTIVFDRCELFAQVGSRIAIGSCVLFTRKASIVTGAHTIEGPETPIMDKPIVVGDVTIGDDCWIGYDALIVKDVTIGKGAVVGAKSLVTKNVEPYTVVGGVPARPIRKRI